VDFKLGIWGENVFDFVNFRWYFYVFERYYISRDILGNNGWKRLNLQKRKKGKSTIKQSQEVEKKRF